MLANFFEGVKGHDRSEMGKNVYKRGYPAVFGAIRQAVVSRVNWHGLPYNNPYEAVDITGRLAIYPEGGH
jgi:hypothetical protein